MNNNLRLIVFDCDGTLVDSGHAIVATMQAAWAREGLAGPDAAAVRQQVGLPLSQAIARIAAEHPPATHERLVAHYRAASLAAQEAGAHGGALFPGCREALDALAAQGTILGVATGKGRRGLEATLDQHGLAPYFTVLKTADDGPGKPNPDILLDAMAEVGADAGDTVMVGDTAFDVEMAVRARTRAVGVTWGYHAPPALTQAGAHALAGGFEELPRLIRGFWSGE